MIAEGVSFEIGLAIGKDIPLPQLRQQCDAVLLAGGAARPRDLRVSGRDRTAVYYAMDYLRQANTASADKADGATGLSARDKTIAVIGGGETGNDCVEMALLQGARKVYQLEIMPGIAGVSPAGMGGMGVSPASTASNSSSQPLIDLEGKIERRWCVATTELQPAGQSIRLSGVQVRWLSTSSGKQYVEMPGTAFHFNVDMVLLALGFDAPADAAMVEQLGLKTDEKGRLIVNQFSTNAPGVFAAGDLAIGASLVAKAIASGRRAAEHIDQYLSRL
jgi:glutamate synthase (NADPH/NADH) small chain